MKRENESSILKLKESFPINSFSVFSRRLNFTEGCAAAWNKRFEDDFAEKTFSFYASKMISLNFLKQIQTFFGV